MRERASRELVRPGFPVNEGERPPVFVYPFGPSVAASAENENGGGAGAVEMQRTAEFVQAFIFRSKLARIDKPAPQRFQFIVGIPLGNSVSWGSYSQKEDREGLQLLQSHPITTEKYLFLGLRTSKTGT